MLEVGRKDPRTGGHIPRYYRLIPDQPLSMTVMDVAEALEFNFNMGCVLKYVIRHGRKPGVDPIEDLRKLIDCALREIARLKDLRGRG